MSGTVEPKSATGETGPGMVPRDPAVMSQFVAGFNGGFQAIHGEFGMMADKVLYLPPKPFGRDGGRAQRRLDRVRDLARRSAGPGQRDLVSVRT